jgi:hypothetical protein
MNGFAGRPLLLMTGQFAMQSLLVNVVGIGGVGDVAAVEDSPRIAHGSRYSAIERREIDGDGG